MYFNFEDRYDETPRIDPAISWREQVLLSIFAHAAIVALILIVPRLEFVQEAEARRLARLAELAALAPADDPARLIEPDPTFVFIEPLADVEAETPPRLDAPQSDRDRIARSPTLAEDPLNALPNADGNTVRFVESPDPRDGLAPDRGDASEASVDPPPADPPPPPDLPPAQDLPPPEAGEPAPADLAAADGPGDDPDRPPGDHLAEAVADGALILPDGGGPAPAADRDPAPDPPPADSLVGRAMRNLDRYARRESFSNQRGAVSRYGPQIQFDSKGADFGPWIRRFVAQVYRNWFMPYAIMSMHGNVVITFNIHRDGSMSDLSVVRPSVVDAFTNSAFNALATSNPTYPLPDDYPDDTCFFTVTFYFNESPPV